LNAAARLVYSARKFEHVTPLLRELHWLRMPERITFRLAVYAYRCQHGLAPPYQSSARALKSRPGPARPVGVPARPGPARLQIENPGPARPVGVQARPVCNVAGPYEKQ